MKIQDLSVSERILLAEKLWDSVADEQQDLDLPEKQQLELGRRLQLFLDEQDAGSPWQEVKARIIAGS